MGTDHEAQEVIGKALIEAKIELPSDGVGYVGSIDDLALTIMNALLDAGFSIVKS